MNMLGKEAGAASPFNSEARWIWGGEEASPRNEWRCFRKTFVTGPGTLKTGVLHITADTRYVLYVNGTMAGRGPVRSWHHQYRYDTYDIKHLLRSGQPNVIAVLVMHYGVATFYNLRGRGGLLAQLELSAAGDSEELKRRVVTDGSWRTALHGGHDRAQPRMAVQQAFAERIDARCWDDGWIEAGFGDAGWEQAAELGEVGMEPWTTLMPRDIPVLTDEPVYPARVLSLKATKGPTWTGAADVRYQWVEGEADHADLYRVAGIVAICIEMERAGSLTIAMVGTFFKSCSIDGQVYGRKMFSGEAPELFLTVELAAGSHLVLFDVTCKDHGRTFRLALDAEVPFQVRSPLSSDGRSSSGGEEAGSPFAVIGPLFHKPLHDTAPPDRAQEDEFKRAARLTEELMPAIGDWNALHACGYPVRAVRSELVRLDDTFAASVWKPQSAAKPIPAALQQLAASSGAGVRIPVYDNGLDTEFLLDFGKQWSGYLEFELDAPAGTVIDFYGFEYWQEGWAQHTYGLDNTLRYTTREGRQTYTSPVRRGFRYLLVTVRRQVSEEQIVWLKTVVRQSNYPVAQVGQFQCSDPLLNDIWEISRHTTRLCMEDTFVDCPAYEQTFWVGDARNEALVNYYVFGASEIVERCLRLVPESRQQTPYYSDQVPSGWVSVIPNWTFFWAIACKEYADHTGSEAFAAEIWPHVQFTLEHYWKHIDENGLFSFQGWNLLDWAPIDQPNDGIVTHQNMFLAKAMRTAAELADRVGQPDQAKLYAERSHSLVHAINRHLWCEDKEAYVDCIHADGTVSSVYSMQTQVVSVVCEIAEGERESLMKRYMVEPPAGFVQIGSPFMSFFYYEGLSKFGETRVMLDDIRRHYGQMLEYEATTCWEMYPGFKEGRGNRNVLTRSHCHAWSAAPGYFLGEQLLGVSRQSAGWKKVKIAPQPAGLAWARGAVPLPEAGCIDVSWKADETKRTFQIQVSAPESIELDISCPEGFTAEIKTIRV